MTREEFEASLGAATPPALQPALLALWRDARGEWDLAHKCVDTRDDALSMWAHAYLHRKEGDLGNAGYWYARAGRAPARGTLAEEFGEILGALLGP
ncbi:MULTISPECIES: hypothetical protein [Methylosinus]|uniref:Sel1 repeat family protein n=1 Tax=Methylosinus trichosporium (strain ATCC 35070 / NCIMB 11131 / UNIQEM 75 / OB3b) TaxID=595536 RepID=A0A2D2D0V7_METT3|nr:MULTISPECIES: hypothetical protein [Methylosinus]ATQ68628.1 hypothetical protein CQW49_12605 [Methylosinus trichosporium OB3b]OBS53207.1 hypothetical protein A8B73_07915 [Methylosinus sp. 3S-1]